MGFERAANEFREFDAFIDNADGLKGALRSDLLGLAGGVGSVAAAKGWVIHLAPARENR